ncbi:MAG TPA: hypothetical protein VGR81_00015 [Candidatus Acidoferrales bacterium]|nr:hypothetical protein [Candidatus Acidoferrales bacterium]
MHSPSDEYKRRHEARLRMRAERERIHIRIGNFKLIVIALFLALAILAFWKHAISGYWVIIPVVVYAALAIWHEVVIRARRHAEIAAAFYERGLARIEDRWSGTGETGERFRDPKHVYTDDMDIFGSGGLFQLLSGARTPMGEKCLARWLAEPSPVAVILERQALVRELRDKVDLREDLAMIGEDMRPRLGPEELAPWAEKPAMLPKSGVRWITTTLAIFAVAATVFWFVHGDFWPLLALLIINSAIYGWLRKNAEATISGMGSNAEGVVLFSQILARIERENFASKRLAKLQDQLKDTGKPASHAIARLARLIYWIDALESYGMKLAKVPFLSSVQLGYASEAWRQRWGRHVCRWIEIAGEIEALLSLAAYSYEHPGDSFPEFAEETKPEAYFAGEELGHPLIPAARCVRNTVRLGKGTRVLLVSGSNMSGKSTLLRTVGINTVLAMAGAPIRGKSLRLSPLRLGTRLRSSDSLQEGRSNFYTEILRIRQVFALTEDEAPLLFLLDELLEGTNSHDRSIGAEGLLRQLVERHAIGIVTTHDLALTEIAGTFDGAMRNAHFEDQIRNGEMSFDYVLRDGIVPRSNALELMRWIGLKV